MRRVAFGLLAVSILFSTKPANSGERQALHSFVSERVSTLRSVDRLSPEKRLNLSIALPLRNREALTNLLQEIYDPTNPQYRQYLTPEQFAERFGPTEQDYQAVVDFAKAQGLTLTGTHPNRTLLNVHGRVADVEKAFRVNLRVYSHPMEARTFYAPDSQPSIDLPTPVLEIVGLDDYVVPRPLFFKKDPNIRRINAAPNGGSGPLGMYMGNDFRAAYVPGVTLTGEGQKIGLFELDGYYTNDPVQYAIQAGLTGSVAVTTLSNVLVGGFDGTPGTNNIEAALDIEMVMAMAPGAQIIVYMAANSGSGAIDILNRMATDDLAKQLSASWSYPTGPATVQVFQQMAGQGQSFFNSSGDRGAYSGAVTGPKDVPYITIVGGTTLTTSGPGGSWVSETTWNWGNGIASGGGISTTWAIPNWQQGIDISDNHGSATMRNLPDVALVADDVYAVANDGLTLRLGGTSVAAPLWAAFTALVNQKARLQGEEPVGFINPALYGIGKGAKYHTAFNDIATGNNTNSSSPTNFFAVTGYDLCTGWGTPTPSLIDELLNVDLIPNLGWTLTSARGQSWTSVASSADGKMLVAVADDYSKPYVSTTWGTTWRAKGPTASWNGVACSADGVRMAAVAPEGRIHISTDSGVTWTATTSPAYFWTSIASSADGAKLAAGAFWEGVFEISTNFGATWGAAAMRSGRYSSVAWSADGNVLVASPGSVVIQVSTNSGLTYFSTGLPGINECWDVASSVDGSTLIAAGNTSICTSKDLGRTWTITDAPARNWSSVASSADGYRLVATAKGDAIYISDDGGITWSGTGPQNSPWTSVACSADGVRLVAVAQDGAVYTGFFPRRPTFIAQPGNQAVNIGGTATFSAAAVGTPPLSYQWLFNGINIPGATGSSLLLTNAQLNDAGAYSVVATNPYGTVMSSSASLVVNLPGPPAISSQPTNQTVLAGGSATFSVTSDGYLPLYYQWMFNETNSVDGATNATLVVSNVQLSQAGRYAVLVTNGYGSVVSSNATLAVVEPQPCAPMPSGLVSWWRAEGDVSDTIRRNNGMLQAGMGFAAGKSGESFLFYGQGSFFDYNIGMRVPASSSLNVGAGNGLTIELWINPEAFNHQSICEWNRFDGSVSAIGSHLEINHSTVGNLRAVLIGPALHNYILSSADGVLNTNSFQHVAFTFDKTTGLAILYRNGVVVASTNMGIFTPQTSFDLFVGIAPFWGNGIPFKGKMDELGLYNRALTQNEIQSVYNGGSSGKCMLPPTILAQPISQSVPLGSNVTFGVTASSPVPISYRWRKDHLNLVSGGRITSVTNATLIISDLRPTDVGTYSVVVSNIFGSVLSSDATLLNAPVLKSLTLMSDGTVQGIISGQAGLTLIEASTNLLHWETVMNIVLTNSTIQFIDFSSTNYPQRFYRVRVE